MKSMPTLHTFLKVLPSFLMPFLTGTCGTLFTSKMCVRFISQRLHKWNCTIYDIDSCMGIQMQILQCPLPLHAVGRRYSSFAIVWSYYIHCTPIALFIGRVWRRKMVSYIHTLLFLLSTIARVVFRYEAVGFLFVAPPETTVKKCTDMTVWELIQA